MKFARVIASAGVLGMGLTACSSGMPSAPQGSDGLTVVAAFYPLQWVAEHVVGERGNVETLVSPGSEAHDLELTPQQIASLPQADLVLYVKGFQPAVDEAISQSGAKALNVADVVTLLPAAGASHDHDHADQTTLTTESTSSEEAHDHADFDPHFWQDPTRMAVLAKALGERLSELDSANATTYASAATTVIKELDSLDQEYASGLNTCQRREFITTHAAFNYLAERYSLEEIGISGINPDAEPSPARIAEVQEEAKVHGINTIFFETLTSDAVAKAIAGDLGLETAVLDPLEGVTEKSPGTDYPSIMRANLAALVKANDCS